MISVSKVAADLCRAIALLTRIPVRADFSVRTAEAAWAYPVVGALLGTIGAMVSYATIGLGAEISAALVLIVWAVLTGAMHEDGLADTADGFWGGWEPARRLEIMRDSRIGTYGVLALICSILLRWAALSMVLPLAAWSLPFVLAASRMPLPWLMRYLPRARPEGLSDTTGRPPLGACLMAGAIGGLAMALVAAVALIPLVIAVAVCALIAKAKIGGQTGDTLGATEQVCQTTLLLTFVALS